MGGFNGDGKLDMVVNELLDTGGYISILLGNGDGTFQPAVNYAAGIFPQWVAVGGFNGDGKQYHTSIAFAGADPGDFLQTNTCGSAVAPGANCTITVSFQPTQRGTRTANCPLER